MKNILIVVFIFCSAIGLNAQMKRPTGTGPSYYFNSFQYFIYSDYDSTTVVDSAYFYLKLLASDPRFEYSLQNLMHNSFAQNFRPLDADNATKEDVKKKYEQQASYSASLLRKMMADTNALLKKTASPLYAWTMATANSADANALTRIIDDYMQNELSEPDIRKNYAGRYGLMIQQVAAANKAVKQRSMILFDKIMTTLKNNQVGDLPDTASYALRDRRAWYRSLYAYCNHVLAKERIAANKTDEAGVLYKAAYKYSPDMMDLNISSAFFYDMIFLMGESDNLFRDEYRDYLMKYPKSRTEAREALLTMAVRDPSLKPVLKEYHEKYFKAEGSFSAYWRSAISKNWKLAPAYLLKAMDGTEFSVAANKGKWLLIDFWGTWCGPCRQEHPDMQQFSKEIKETYSSKIGLMTIACMDTEAAVTKYMKEKNFSFPVSMSDGKVQTVFPVTGYPTKILINPEGKYTTIPFGIKKWVEFVKEYCDL